MLDLKFPTLVYLLMTLLVISFSNLHSAEKTAEAIILTENTRDQCLKILRDVLRQATEKEDAKFWPAMHAAEALTLAGHSAEVRQQLTPLLKTEQNDRHRCGLARELVRAGDRSQAAVMLKILEGKEEFGHIHACESLYKVKEIGDGIAMRRALQQKDNPVKAIMAAGALARWGNPAAYKLLRKSLAGDDAKQRQIAAWVLARVGDSSDIPEIYAAAKRTDDLLEQAYFTNAQATLGDKSAQQKLLKNLSSENAAIRTYSAVFASDARLASAHQLLIPLLNDKETDVRVRAAQSLLCLAKPDDTNSDKVVADVYQANQGHPRYSEGSILPLPDGSLLYAITEFNNSGSDFAAAQIIARTSRDAGRTWSSPRLLQENVGGKNVMSVTLRYLDKPTKTKRAIGMFYLVKNSLSDLKVYIRISNDNAQTFGKPIMVTAQPGYHVLNNDRVTQLSTGRWLVPIASTDDVGKVNHFVSRCMISDDGGRHWRQGKNSVDYAKRGAMEPEVIELKDGRVLMIFRTQLGHIAACTSADGGDTWSKPKSFNVRAPEAPATLRRIPSTGDLILIWNDNYQKGAGHSGKRTPLTVAISTDEGKTWKLKRRLETDPQQTYSYISLCFQQGRAIISYYVRNEKTARISSRFRSIPIAWFYELDQQAASDASGQPQSVLHLPPGKGNPRNSEGDFIRLKDGRLMFVYSHFYGGNSDHARAQLNARFSEDSGKTWSNREITLVKNEGGFNVMSVSLLRLQNDSIALFYLRKNSLTDCRPVLRISTDEGKTWGDPIECISDHVGYYVMNNDRAVQLKNGRLVLPVALHHVPNAAKPDWSGQVLCYLSDDNGKSWRRNRTLQKATSKTGSRLIAQEPGVVELKDGRVMMFVRSNAGSQLLAFSQDGCETFSKLAPSNIISPVSPASIERIPQTDDLLLVWNNHQNIAAKLRAKRTPFTVAISRDEGKTWERVKTILDNPTGWYCYTAVEFVDNYILLGHCAGDRNKNNGLAESQITRLSLKWLYSTDPQ